MDFAKTLLSKYGWEEGKGLGKHETGITKAIKPKLKFDNAGIGHDSAETFTHYWWEHAYNDAANNITVCQIEDGISVKTAHELDVSTRKVSSKKRKNLIFNNFLKSASTLTNEGLIVTSEEAEPTEGPAAGPPMTDEELFAACGSRTAHKGARHGLGLGGKLARVEEQERKALAMISTDPKVEDVRRDEGNKRKKKKSRKSVEDSSHDGTDAVEDAGRKHKKQKSGAGSEDVQDVNTALDITGEKRKRSKKLAAASSDSELGASLGAGEMEKSAKKDKKRKAVEGTEESEDLLVDDTILVNTNEKRKKSKKSAVASSNSEMTESLEAGSDLENNTEKRKKKKSRASTQDPQDNINSENTSVELMERTLTETIQPVEANVSEIITEKRKKQKKRKLEAELEQTEPLKLNGSNGNSINPDIDVGSIVKKAKKSKRKHLTEC